MEYDLIARGGWVIDGTGGPAFRADVAVLDSVIAAVGHLGDSTAAKVLDATGLTITPGFIDAHVHGDLMLLADPVHLPALKQGVTTYIIGQDGCSFAPGSAATIDYMRRYTAGFNGNPPNIDYDWNGVDEYLARFDRKTAINVAYLIPNGNVRIEVIGHDPRPATDHELRAMQKMVRDGMEAGAVGLSTGLDYLPSRHADAREIAALCEVLVPDDGVYVTHMRAYGANSPVGMEEVYDIVRRSGVAAHISHYNGPADIMLPLIDKGLAMGFDLTFDTYPYLAGSTILGMVSLPPWVQEGGNEATLERLADRTIRARLESDWFPAPTQFPLNKVHLAMVANPTWRWAEGKTVIDAAKKAGQTPCDFICDILLASDLAVGVVSFRAIDRTEEDVRAILRHPSHMAGSDGIFRGGYPHPRGTGAFARYLGYHTRTLGDYTWPEAISHLTSHAARRYRLTDRGMIRPGYVADIALFDASTITDRSTYADGKALAEGVRHVIVDGTMVLEDGLPTGATPGRALRRG
ncbi:N-acyl-D-amino-acid deacylase family protein [Tundrisphaera lichenicola]|uniref:N-acyl-D-amino-acid deacylase family protein n=1 Tax=Tundrisphaera lichenicola TaxID=2029860 RepID=UPI003EB92CA9